MFENEDPLSIGIIVKYVNICLRDMVFTILLHSTFLVILQHQRVEDCVGQQMASAVQWRPLYLWPELGSLC